MKHFERLLDPDQLIAYPSAEHPRFNETYEAAQACISSGTHIQELYIIQYRDKGGQLHFSFVSTVQLDVYKPNSSYGLKDICGVVRR